MHSFKKTTACVVAAALTIVGLAPSAFAREAPMRVVLNCNHEDTLLNFAPAPTRMDLEVAGAGWATHMRGAVVCISQNYSFDLSNGLGAATFKLRDCTGDLLVYKADMILQPSSDGKHFGEFAGNYVIDPAASTGRFAGANGAGTIWGWADNDAEPVFTILADGTPCLKGSGQGYVEMTGTIVLANKSPCSAKK